MTDPLRPVPYLPPFECFHCHITTLRHSYCSKCATGLCVKCAGECFWKLHEKQPIHESTGFTIYGIVLPNFIHCMDCLKAAEEFYLRYCPLEELPLMMGLYHFPVYALWGTRRKTLLQIIEKRLSGARLVVKNFLD